MRIYPARGLPRTRLAYTKTCDQFLAWCEDRDVERLQDFEQMVIAAYIERISGSEPTVKMHPTAIVMLFDWPVTL